MSIQDEHEYGSDTAELLYRIAAWRPGTALYLEGLRITSLPPLPNDLEGLYCNNTELTTIPSLPIGLKLLYCRNTQLTSLPPLPNSLKQLHCGNTPLTSLPPLPARLRILSCSNTLLTSLPSLPNSLETIYCSNTPLIIQKDKDESVQSYEARWAEWRWNQVLKEAKDRCSIIKEELIATVWHPQRVERWLEAGGWDAIEAM